MLQLLPCSLIGDGVDRETVGLADGNPYYCLALGVARTGFVLTIGISLGAGVVGTGFCIGIVLSYIITMLDGAPLCFSFSFLSAVRKRNTHWSPYFFLIALISLE